MMKSFCLASAVCMIVLAAPAHAQPRDERFTITPYLWLPTVEGEFRYDVPPGAGGRPDVSVGPVDYLENLSGVFMIAGEARFDRTSVFTDFIYLDFDREDASVRSVTGPGPIQIPIDAGSEAELSGMLWTLAGGYDVINDDNVRLQVFGGVRYLSVDSSINWRLSGPLSLLPQSGSISRDADAWDGLVGVRGEGRYGHWVFPYYVDIGAGDSDLTWQASVGAGYRFGWGDIRLDYRYLSYEQDGDSLVQELTFDGPAFSASFHF
jgi:hypothetical protein